MNLKSLEEFLWQMGNKVSGQTGVTREAPFAPSTEQLAAYRQGRLKAEEAERLEQALAEAAEARDRMAAVAGLSISGPGPHLRESVLASYDASLRSRRFWRWWLRAVALLTVASSVFLLNSVPPPLPEDLTYDVRAEGLSKVRGRPPIGHRIVAEPITKIQITASPQPAAFQNVDFGLYRRSGDRLELLPFGSSIRVKVHRGAAEVTARARDLVGSAETSTFLFLVAACPGDLPTSLERGAQVDRLLLEDNGRRRAYPLEIRLQPPEEE